MGKVIAITNQKGGVGKTTTAINLSASMGILGKKVLVIDVDPQGNTTSGLGFDRRSVVMSTYDILVDGTDINQVILNTEFKNVSVIPSNIDLAAADLELIDLPSREARLKNAILPVVSEYDYIIIDCPPSLGLITTNALCVSDSILIPAQCEYYALEGISQLMNTVKRIKRQYNEKLEIEGVLMTMYDSRLNLTKQVVDEVKKHFSKKVFNTVIPRGVRLSEAPSFGQPVWYFDKTSKGAKAYVDLAEEICKNNEQF